MSIKDPEKRRASNRANMARERAASPDVQRSRYAKWIRTPAGWASLVIKQGRTAAKIGGHCAPSYTRDALIASADAWDRACQCCGRKGMTVPIDEDHSQSTGAHVDHDHSDGRLRGFLCPRCNVRVGVLEQQEQVALCQAYIAKSRA